MKFEDVKNLIALIRENDISEVEIEEPNLRIRIRRNSSLVETTPVSQEKSAVLKSELGMPSSLTETTDTPARSGEESDPSSYDEERFKKVYAPLVGTFYRAPAPDTELFVEVGDVIKKGTVICIIEAMKVMNEIESEHSGKVIAIPVEDSTPVEYGEPICIIDPFG